jgi:hypothetical protein
MANDSNGTGADTTGGTPAGIEPAPDSATERTWRDQLVAKITGMILDWRETKIAYSTMVAARGAFGLPVVDGASWTQAQDDEYTLLDYVVHTLANYVGEVSADVRKVAYDTFGDQVVMLGDPGDIQLSAANGVLTISAAGKTAAVDPGGFTGVAWPVVVIVVAGVAAHIVLVISISTVIRDYIKRLTQKDALAHEEAVASQIIANGGDPVVAHQTATQQTNDQLAALAAKARADAEADDKGGLGQVASTVRTVAWVALGVVLVAGAAYFALPTITKALESRGSAAPRLAQQNPARSRKNIELPGAKRRIIGTTGDVNMFDYDAGVVFSDEYGTHWEWWQWEDESDESPQAKATIYRADLDDDIFAEHNWANVDSVASTIGADPDELRKAGRSRSAMERQYALEAITAYYGSRELDSYPLDLTRAELRARWRNVNPRKTRKNPGKPQPIEGYAYSSPSGKNNKHALRMPDSKWDTVMLDEADGPFVFVGTRTIDGSLCNVWVTGNGQYYAQLEHMTQGA